jgi:hypothetical protein
MSNKNEDNGIAWSKVFFVLTIAVAIAVWIHTSVGEDVVSTPSGQRATEKTAVLDVFVPKEACHEIVGQNFSKKSEWVRFDVLCRDEAGNYTGYAAGTKRHDRRAGMMIRYNYHFTNTEEMKIEERIVLNSPAEE